MDSSPMMEEDLLQRQDTNLVASRDGFNLPTPPPPARETFRDIAVKVHVRRPDKDTWLYLGRGLVSQELNGHSSRIVVRSLMSKVEIAVFSESTELQAERRGNFVVIGCVEGASVVSWSLHALNNSETLRLLASIEIACYRCKQANADPRLQSKVRRRVERTIRDDRRRRHRRRKDQEALVEAFARQNFEEPMDLMLGSDEHPGSNDCTDDGLGDQSPFHV